MKNEISIDLPMEIWQKIFRFLDKKCRKNATLTCRKWFKIIRHDTIQSGYLILKYPAERYINSILENWPALKSLHLHLETRTCKPENTEEKLKRLNICFDQCSLLEKVVIEPKYGFRFEKTCQRSFQVSVIKTICFNPKIDVDPIDLKNALKITVFEPTKMAQIQKVLKWNIKKFRKLESLTFSCEDTTVFDNFDSDNIISKLHINLSLSEPRSVESFFGNIEKNFKNLIDCTIQGTLDFDYMDHLSFPLLPHILDTKFKDSLATLEVKITDKSGKIRTITKTPFEKSILEKKRTWTGRIWSFLTICFTVLGIIFSIVDAIIKCYIQYYILYLAISGTLWPNSTNSNDINFDKNQRRDYGERRRIPN